MADPQGSHRATNLQIVLCRFWFSVLLSLIVAFFFSFIGGLIAVVIANFPVSKPHPMAVQCKIISSSVDLRSSKVCELGLLNYKAKHVLFPLDRKGFRCRYDYYWASIFKVEYKQYSSGQTLHALAEAPKEALPLDCRPNFGTAWLTKDKFKVNQTYNCRYTPGTSKVDIYADNFFNCRAKEPSTLELMRRFIVLFTRSMNSFFSEKAGALHISWDMIVGMIVGMPFSIVIVNLVKLLLKPWLAGNQGARKIRVAVFEATFRRACLLVVSLSAMGWLSIQYGKMLGLSEVFISSYFGKKLMKT